MIFAWSTSSSFCSSLTVTPQWRGRIVLGFNVSSEMRQAITHAELVFALRDEEQEEHTNNAMHASICHLNQNMCGHEYGIRRHFGSMTERWDVFNVSFLLSHWSPYTTLHIDMYGMSAANYTNYIVDGPDRPSLVFWTSSVQPDAVFSVNPENVQRQRRSIDKDIRQTSDQQEEKIIVIDEPDENSLCHLHPWIMDFTEVEWHWIIHPRRFMAYYCTGLCPVNLTDSDVGASNHAILRHETISAIGGASPVPYSCCAPSRLGLHNFLYFTADYSVVLRAVPEMVAERCACL